MFLVNGVTGIRDAGSEIPLKRLHVLRQSALSGMHAGPPRQLFSGPAIAGPCMQTAPPQVCASDEASIRKLVDSIQTAGADLIKLRAVSTSQMYYAAAAEARRLGIPFGGHIQWETKVTAAEASDSGARFLDHKNASGGLDSLCFAAPFVNFGGKRKSQASLAACQSIAQKLRTSNTWHVTTQIFDVEAGQAFGAKRSGSIRSRLNTYLRDFLFADTLSVAGGSNWLHGSVDKDTVGLPSPDSIGILRIVQRAQLPVVVGTDGSEVEAYVRRPDFSTSPTEAALLGLQAPGFALQAELAILVAEGMSPLSALQAATLNPAKALRATDSLGTVAKGKLADLVLLDADPLEDITNTTTIRAVFANGRYYDRAALDQLLAHIRAAVKR
jgi:hypothetical protein